MYFQCAQLPLEAYIYWREWNESRPLSFGRFHPCSTMLLKRKSSICCQVVLLGRTLCWPWLSRCRVAYWHCCCCWYDFSSFVNGPLKEHFLVNDDVVVYMYLYMDCCSKAEGGQGICKSIAWHFVCIQYKI